jgi:Transposase DDE domain
MHDLPSFGVRRLRFSAVWASPSTWYRLVRRHGWSRPRLRVHPAKPKTGLRTTRANEMWQRQTEGFLRSLFGLMGLDLPAPDHTTLSRRAQSLDLTLRHIPPHESLHLVIDSTGLSIVGEANGPQRNMDDVAGGAGESFTSASTNRVSSSPKR